MSDDKKTSSGALPAGGLVWIVIFAAGAFLAHEVPWQGSRPTATDPKAYPYVAKQDIDSRLWQDPLSAVVRGREDVRKQYPKEADGAAKGPPAGATNGAQAADCDEVRPRSEAEAHAPSILCLHTAANRKGGRTLVLGVMIPGGSYPESVEYRRRMRYAALAALDRMGFAPDDPEHLGYVLPQEPQLLPEFIAYEWLSPKGGEGPAILTLWLDEDIFGTNAIKHFDSLVAMLTRRASNEPVVPVDCSADNGPAIAPDFLIIGPSYTSTLQDLLHTIRSEPCPKRLRLPIFYSYGATTDDADILMSVGYPTLQDSVHAAFHKSGVQVFRAIGTDSRLGAALKAELILRGVDPAAKANCAGNPRAERDVEHVVRISERDTFYGRSLPETMTDDFRGAGCAASRVGSYIHRYSYLRGLDGQVSSIGSDAASKAGSPKGDGAGGSDRTSKEKQIERPEGQGQLDYLRRLSLQLAALDHDLRRNGKGTIKAVGVLGSDVYDKLLVLQALRQQFQNVLFFTTDLDARMLHPQEQDWARNLVVASNFGLQLNTGVQADILPFRDGYQTSVYLSTQIALYNALHACSNEAGDPWPCIDQEKIGQWLDKPRVFEIGRTAAFDFSDPRATACDPSTKSLTECADMRREIACDPFRISLADCRDIHPAGSARYTPITSNVFRDAVLLLFLGGVLIALARGFGTRISRWIAERRWLPIAVCVANAAVIVAFAFFGAPAWTKLADYLTAHNDGEPISLVQGLSIWPSEAIRATAVIASILFLLWAWRLLEDNVREIARTMRFQLEHQVMVAQVDSEYATWTWWRRLIRRFSFRLTEYAGGPLNPSVGLSWRAQVFWKRYLYQGRFGSRMLRVAAAVIVYLVVANAVIGYFGAPNTPYRGMRSMLWNSVVLGASVSTMLFVIFFVVDAIVFCHQIIQALQIDLARENSNLLDPGGEQIDSHWASSTLHHYHTKFGIAGRHLDSWILMDFITLRTRVVAKLIYFPFIVISLIVLSRSQFFDNWTMPIGLVAVLGCSVLIVSGCAILLRESAESARRKVLKLLNDDLIRLKGNEGRTGQQIEAIIAQVRDLHEGAFAPYSAQPLFRALLLPLSTFGGSALLDWLTMSSF